MLTLTVPRAMGTGDMIPASGPRGLIPISSGSCAGSTALIARRSSSRQGYQPAFYLDHDSALVRRSSPARVDSAAFLVRGSESLVLTGSEDDHLRVFSTRDGKLVSIARGSQFFSNADFGHSPEIAGVAPDGSFFVVTNRGGTFRAPVVFDNPNDLSRFQVLDGHRFTASPQQKAAAAQFKNRPLRHVFLTPDSKHILTVATEGEILVWTKGGGVEKRFLPSAPIHAVIDPNDDRARFRYAYGRIASTALSPDGRTLALGLSDGRIATYSVSELVSGGKDELLPQHVNNRDYYDGGHSTWGASALAFTPDGLSVIAAMWNQKQWSKIAVLNRNSLDLADTRSGHIGKIDTVRTGADRRVVTTTYHPEAATRIWNLSDPRYQANIQIGRAQGEYYLGTGDHVSFPAAHDRTPGSFDASVVTTSPDGKYLVMGTEAGKVVVVELASGRLMASIRAFHDIRAVAISPDGKYLFTGGHLGDARLFDFAQLVQDGPLRIEE